VSPDVLSRRALNRALLARQLLLQRVRLEPTEALEALVGLQAQAPEPPYLGLWARLDGFEPGPLGRLVEDGGVARIALMRSTIHLVSRRDCLRLRPVVQPALESGLRASYGKALTGVPRAKLERVARVALEEKPRTSSELGRLLAERWPDRSPQALANAARAWLPLLQIPPRGVWGRSGRAVHAPADSFLGASFEDGAGPDDLALRYLGSFGPASVADVQQWSGLTGLREILDRLRPGLRLFRDESGQELFDLPDAPRPHADTPAPVRLVAPFDNLILSHADRTRIMDDQHRSRIATLNGMVPGTVLLDGFVAGLWRTRRESGKTLSFSVERFRRWSKREERDVRQEAEALVDFMRPEGWSARIDLGR